MVRGAAVLAGPQARQPMPWIQRLCPGESSSRKHDENENGYICFASGRDRNRAWQDLGAQGGPSRSQITPLPANGSQ